MWSEAAEQAPLYVRRAELARLGLLARRRAIRRANRRRTTRRRRHPAPARRTNTRTIPTRSRVTATVERRGMRVSYRSFAGLYRVSRHAHRLPGHGTARRAVQTMRPADAARRVR